jgi:hypothetical protein
MAYRDDQTALHARVQQLERDLERARREAELGQEARCEVEVLWRSLAKVKRQLDLLSQPMPVARWPRAALLGVAVLLIISAGAAVLLLR